MYNLRDKWIDFIQPTYTLGQAKFLAGMWGVVLLLDISIKETIVVHPLAFLDGIMLLAFLIPLFYGEPDKWRK